MAPRPINHCENVELQNVIALQCAGAAKQAEEQKKKNREIIHKLMRSYTSWLRIRIPHSTTYKELIELQMLMGAIVCNAS